MSSQSLSNGSDISSATSPVTPSERQSHILRLDEYQLKSHTLPFKPLVIGYLCCCCALSAAILVAFEAGRTSLSYFNAFFIAVNAMTCTGFTAFSLTALSSGSQVVVAILIQLGSSFLLSMVPLLMRYHALSRRFAPRVAVHKLQPPPTTASAAPIPEWLIELKAARMLIGLLLATQLVAYALGFALLCVALAIIPADERGTCSYADAANQTGPRPCKVAPTALFLTISAFNNAGNASATVGRQLAAREGGGALRAPRPPTAALDSQQLLLPAALL